MEEVYPEPLPPPGSCPQPWNDYELKLHETPGTARNQPPEVRKRAAEALLQEIIAGSGEPHIQVWSDGSAEDRVLNGGAGAVVRQVGLPDEEISVPAGAHTSSTAAEAVALEAGLQVARTRAMARPNSIIWAAFDSKALFERLQSPWNSKDAATASAASILGELSRAHQVHVIWVPGHAGLELNELEQGLSVWAESNNIIP